MTRKDWFGLLLIFAIQLMPSEGVAFQTAGDWVNSIDSEDSGRRMLAVGYLYGVVRTGSMLRPEWAHCFKGQLDMIELSLKLVRMFKSAPGELRESRSYLAIIATLKKLYPCPSGGTD
jgi:hypothetical protein